MNCQFNVEVLILESLKTQFSVQACLDYMAKVSILIHECTF